MSESELLFRERVKVKGKSLLKTLSRTRKAHKSPAIATSPRRGRFVAFTLAEILVTLSILGVIAAVTVPSVYKKYQKSMTISRLKIAYSILDNLTQMSYAENGYPPVESETAANKVFFDKYFGKYLNISKVCGSTHGGSILGSGCFKSGWYRDNASGEKAVNENGEELKRDMFYDLDGNDVNQNGYNPAFSIIKLY